MTALAQPTQSDVLSRLTDLGETPDQVAQALFELGVRGYPGRSVMCPVATWLKLRYSGEWTVSSSETHSLGDLASGIVVGNPEQVAQFIEDFDGGKYTDLYPDDYDYSLFLAGV
jgi:hypothetical protein